MTTVNMHEAKTNLSRLVESLVSGEETEVTIARNGVPAVTMHAVQAAKPPRGPSVFGAAKGKFTIPDDFDEMDKEIEELFNQPPDW